MAFQPRTEGPQLGQSGASPSGANSLDSLVDRIVDAVRDRLVAEGMPLPSNPNEAVGQAFRPANTPDSPAVNRAAEIPASQSQAAGGSGFQQMISHGADRVGHVGETPFQPHVLGEDQGMAAKIDHTLLKPDATSEEIKRVCKEARDYHFATVCVNSSHVEEAARYLEGSGVKPIAVVGFPLGAASTATKSFEAREAVRGGAKEIDMVINIGALKGKEYLHVFDDIRAVVEASKPFPVKVILENSSLDYEEKVIACALSKAANAAFVKTSTGFGSGGATADDIALMRRVVGPEMGVKASGGIRSREDADKMVAAGANRIGASASIEIVTGKGQKKTDGSSKKKGHKSSLY